MTQLAQLVSRQAEITKEVLGLVSTCLHDLDRGRRLLDAAQVSDRLRISLEKCIDGANAPQGLRDVTNVPQASDDEPISDRDEATADERYLVKGSYLLHRGVGRNGGYEHSISRSDFGRVVEVVRTMRGRREFRMDDIAGGLPGMPQYHPYLVINALRQEGIVHRPKKGRYQLVTPDRLTDIDNLWGSLPDR